MKKNVGTVDKIIRLLAALAVGVLYFTNVITGTLAIILGVVALIFVITSFMGFCGLYSVFGIRTCSVKNQNSSTEQGKE